ncbi:MAG: hypothetical protein AB1488_06400 [Nitrospirota bacterium]
MKKTILTLITLVLALSLYGDVYAEEEYYKSEKVKSPDNTYSPPYGGYCPGHRWGWYGAYRQVKTTEEARSILMEYCASATNVKVGRIIERKRFFEAEIYGKDNSLVDRVLIDKKTGRIRSMY